MQLGAQCLVVPGVSLLLGCGRTAYQPAKSARVAATSDGYVRDGIVYPAGFGGGLVEALHVSPPRRSRRVEAEATTLGKVGVGVNSVDAEPTRAPTP